MDEIKPVFVLDACAILRLVQDEPGADKVAEILGRAARGECRVMMHQINFGEAVYRIGKRFGWAIAERKRHEMTLLSIEIIPFTDELFWDAVKLKAQYPMSYADCFAAALAMQENAILLTSDPEFEVLGDSLMRLKI